MQTLAATWAMGTRRLLILRVFGFDRLKPGSTWKDWVGVYVWVLGLTLIVPLSAQGVFSAMELDGFHARTDGGRNALIFTSALGAMIVGFSGLGWVVIGRRIVWFDELLPGSSVSKAVRVLESLYKYQALGVGAGVIGSLAVLLNVPVFGAYVPSNLVAWYSMLVLALSAGFALVSTLWVPQLVTVFWKTPTSSIRFLPVHFAATPGVVLMSEAVVLGAAALMSALAFAVCLWLYIRYSPDLLPAYMEGSVLLIALVLVLLQIPVALVPILRIHIKLMEVKSERLQTLDLAIRTLEREVHDGWCARRGRHTRSARDSRRSILIEELAVVGESSTLPSRALALVPFAAAVVGPVVAFLLLWAVGDPPLSR